MRPEGPDLSGRCGPEAAWASPEMEIVAPSSLTSSQSSQGQQVLLRPQPKSAPAMRHARPARHPRPGSASALEVAAAGGHNLLMVGPPAPASRCWRAPAPRSCRRRAGRMLEVSMIASIAGQLDGGALTNRRPFRAPHHSASHAGAGRRRLGAKPGGSRWRWRRALPRRVPEFDPRVLDSLRQPLETARSRSRAPTIASPIRARSSDRRHEPVPLGRANEPGLVHRGAMTRCTGEYQARLSGPLLDRIDLHIEVPAVTAADLIFRRPRGSRESPLGSRAPLRCRRSATRRSDRPTCAPMRAPKAPCSTKSPSSTALARADPRRRRRPCGSRRAAYHRVLRVARRSPISTAATRSAACISRGAVVSGAGPMRCAGGVGHHRG